MLSKIEQLTLGSWLSLTVAVGILSHSLSAALQPLLVGVFFCTPFLFNRMIGTAKKAWRVIGIACACIWLGVIGFGLLNIAEGIYLVNGDHYPRWLADGELSPKDPLQMERICRRGVDMYTKPNGLFVWRCGSIWYESTTMISTFNPYEAKGALDK